MQQKLINTMGEDTGFKLQADTHLSFKPFLDYVRLRLQEENSIKKEIYQMVLDKFSPYPELEGEVELDTLPKYKHLLDLLHVVLTSVVEDETKIYWALCSPMTPLVFYGSDPFYQMLDLANTHDCECGLEDEDYEEFIKSKQELFYNYILKKFYGIQFRANGNIVRSMPDPVTGLTRHFSLNVNTSFVDATPKKPLPKVDVELMRNQAMADNAMPVLHEILPIDMFTFSGFSILTISDVTPQYALESIRDNITKNKSGAENRGFPQIVQSLKELVGSNDVEFNILPLIKVNGKVVDDLSAYCQSILFSCDAQKQVNGGLFHSMIEKFVEHPKLVYYSDIEIEGPTSKEAAKIMHNAGVSSFALLPVFYNKKLVGAIEVFSKIKGALNEKVLATMEPARELLAQLLENTITAFDDEIEAVTKEKFTSLQPSVQWKFNEVAWHYLQKRKDGVAQQEPEEISFENVYPLYGAVDVRNSTIERNAALNKDLVVQFDVLLSVLQQLKKHTGFGLLDEKIYAAKQWAEKVSPNASLFNQEVKLNDFLENDMVPFLIKFTDKQPELFAIAETYFNAIDERTGIAYQNRRALEASMTTVISSVNNYFDLFRNEIQQAYPCYFEKFRTDGVEYDIYIGQSITPGRPYSDIYLKNLRLMQLSSMAAVTKYTHALLPELATPVETTQLIFIHSHPIDIRFRPDEKRFDVEGAYNIRYHIIKKRIDKVHLKDSSERLTQPQKIALVYFNQKEADEYISYIRYLQGEGVLHNDLEFLELEEVQGVSELKALRVGVNLG
ncbi:MAG: GAF domain-containing protein [Bacteroidota bacterium]